MFYRYAITSLCKHSACTHIYGSWVKPSKQNECHHAPTPPTPRFHPPSHTRMRVLHSYACTHSGLCEWGWEAVTVSVGMASYQTIRLPSDSLSRWRWDRASEARTPADTESMEASPDLLPDGGALMRARVSLVSPVWLGLHWCQDAGAFRARRPRFWRAATAPLHGLSSRSRWRDTISPGSQRYS